MSCLPADLPPIIEYDVSQEDAESVGVRISQLTMPDGLTALYKTDFAVLRIRPPKMAEEEELEEGAEEEGAEETEEAEE